MRSPAASTTDRNPTPLRVSALEGYRLWSQTYDQQPNPLLALELRTLSHKLGMVSGKVFLDVACGTGRWMIEAASRGAKTFGVDLCFEMLAVAAAKPRLAGCLMQAHGRSLPLPDKLADMAMCSFSVGYMEPLDQVIRELCRVTKPGGSVLVTEFHPCTHRLGWRRSFRSGSEVFEIESHQYTSEQLVDAGRSAGLELNAILEPHFGEPEKQIMRSAGKKVFVEQVSAIPAVLIVEWKRR